jgi:hypothetical protein
MNQSLRQFVRDRAERRCEYCGISEEHDLVLPFHIEHIRARKHGGGDEAENLALACHHCILRKGSNLSGVDPRSNAVVELYHPRRDLWSANFAAANGLIEGLTPTGRATVATLAFNRPDRVELRRSIDA